MATADRSKRSVDHKRARRRTRVGLALAVGSGLGGALVVLLRLIAGERNPMFLTGSWLLGTVFVAIGITAVVGPLWLVLHVAGLRRARHASNPL